MQLPGILAEMSQLIGEASALLIAAHAGGRRIYVPARVSDNHWLVACIGRARAEAICKHFAVDGRGTRLDIPLGDVGGYAQLRRVTARRIHELHRQGASASQISRAIGVTMRTVHRHRKAHRGGPNDAGQGSLF